MAAGAQFAFSARPFFGSVLIYEFFGARIVLNPQRVASQ